MKDNLERWKVTKTMTGGGQSKRQLPRPGDAVTTNTPSKSERTALLFANDFAWMRRGLELLKAAIWRNFPFRSCRTMRVFKSNSSRAAGGHGAITFYR